MEQSKTLRCQRHHLIMNINNDLESFDIDKCNNRFDNFKKLHDIEVERLKGNKNLSSIAI